MMEVVVSQNKPSNEEQWNALCEANGNLLQSSLYDEVNDFYRQKSVYFQIVRHGILIGGVKLLAWKANRISLIFGPISNSITQFGEFIFHKDCADDESVKEVLIDAITNYCVGTKVVSLTINGFYGGLDKLYQSNKMTSRNDFLVSYIDLTKSEQELLSQMHGKHRNAYNRAVREKLVFERNVKCEILIDLLTETYAVQNKNAPNLSYIQKMYNDLESKGLVEIFAVKSEGEYLSAALVQKFGLVADYTFGGNKKNNVGAGQFLQFNICKCLQLEKFTKYSLGQVAAFEDESNMKFSKGISEFKTRFGTFQVESCSQKMVFSSWKYNLFNFLKRLV